MKPQNIFLQLKNPCEPLISDKCLLWLAGTFGAAGHPLRSLAAREEIPPAGLLLTNLPVKGSFLPGSGCAVLKLTSSGDRAAALKRLLGHLYGRTRYFHPPSAGGSGRALRRLIKLAVRSFAGRLEPETLRDEPSGTPAEPEIPEGRSVIFRVNVDWDRRGLELLERWCERFSVRPTLAVAGSEVANHRKRVQDFVARHQVDIASHSFSHYVVLSSQSLNRQRREIVDNQSFLEDLCGKPVSGFVAPYVRYDRRTFDLLQEYGYRWFIRSWLLHPVGLPGYRLLDLGVNFYFSPGWETRLPLSLARSDLVFQLHLRDLVKLESEIERTLAYLAHRRVSFIDCSTYYQQRRERCFL